MITPDTKDWTWVLERPCPECGLDVRTVPREEVSARLRRSAAAWDKALHGSGDLRMRPRPEVWSPVEYACHVRDVCRLFLERLEMMLTRDDPAYPDWNQDEAAVKGRYGEQEPLTVAAELGEAAEALARRFDGVAGEDWQRTGVRSDGVRFTVESFARYLLHDVVHHLHDVTGARAG